MEKINRRNMRNKTQKGVLNKKSILNNYFASILKLNLALALLILFATVVMAEPVIVKAGNLNVTKDLHVDTNTLYVDSTNNKVGIGTPTPLEALTVAGNTIISGMLNATSFYQSGNIVLDASTYPNLDQ